MITILAFFVTLGVLIVIHEYGHYRVAVACGVKVLRFSVGFGRVIWRRQPTPGGTEFVISALPLGGYVRMLDEREGAVAPHELSMAFNRKPLWQRAAVVAAGPVANLLLAIVLYAAQHWIGVDEPKARFGAPVAASLAERAGLRAGDLVRAYSHDGEQWEDVRSMTDLRWEVTQSVLRGQRLHLMVSDGEGRGQRVAVLELDTLNAKDIDAKLLMSIGLGAPYSGDTALLAQVKPGGAGAKAGLRDGDLVRRVDGVDMRDSDQLRQLIRDSAAQTSPKPMLWQVQRDGRLIDISVQPAVVAEGEKRIGRIEASLGKPPEMVTVQYGPWDGLSHAVSRTWEVSSLTVRMLGRMLIGQASFKNLSGPLTIADYAGQSVRLGLAYYLGFLAVVSVGLGVLNLLPLPVLDGGHLMYYLFEAVTGQPLSDAWLERLQRGGVAIMLMMTSLALYNDVARLLGLH
ncbi:MAG: RIP metalloprotease RseP [Cytophagales bacterium]|nr:RIP metalloprotease RseP [Rhizobacter sp.]